MRSSWDPLSLAFSDAELEAHYSKHLAVSTFVSVDAAFAFFGIVSCLWLAGVYWRGSLTVVFLVTAVVNGICGLVIVLALRRSARAWYRRRRTMIILVLRTVRIFAGLCCYTLDPSELPDRKQLSRLGIFCILCIYWSSGMPLNIKIHVVHHSIALALCYLCVQSVNCGNYLMMWQKIFKFLTLFQSCDLQPEEQCRRVFLFALFVGGFAVPTYVLWLTELRSRLHYMSVMQIPIVGKIERHYLAVVLGFASLSVWLLVLII